MAKTTPGREQLDTATTGQAVITKAIQGTGITLSATGVDAGTGDVTINLTVPVALASGGTGQITALAARGSSGLNIESRTAGIANANYTILATDRYVATTTTVFTAARTATLPAANAVNAGIRLYIGDDGGAITSAFALNIARAGTDTINKQTTSITLTSPFSSIIIESDGVSNWTIVVRSPAVKVLVFAGGTSYGPTIGTKALYVECVGGGGGSGGVTGGSGTGSAGGGGGGGAYSATFISNPKASYTYAIGAGGAAGATAGGTGGTGGDTTFDVASVCTAKGGLGGVGLGAIATVNQANGGKGGASASGVGDVKCDGSDGENSFVAVIAGVALPNPGNGGGSFFAGACRTSSVVQGAGTSGQFYGGGASGALGTTTSSAGSAGAVGVIRVTEYF
jgi:hypothetical protein